MIAAEYIRSILDYDPDTGVFRWKYREGLAAASWNSKWAGKIAGTSGQHGGYISISINKVLYRGHVLAWLWVTGEWPKNEIDHRNRARGDNRFDNLRLATRQQNSMNRTAQGVYFQAGKWVARIKINGKQVYLGRHINRLDARAARLRMQRILFGEFASTE
jgi:hypothetical protein